MNIVTISDDGWLCGHTKRWVRYVRKYCKDVKVYLLYAGKRLDSEAVAVLDAFDKVVVHGSENADREWYNRVRMGACSELGVDEVLYCDADADVLEDVGGVGEQGDKDLLWVRSPFPYSDYPEFVRKVGRVYPGVMANNGLLYMRRDWSEEYAKAREELRSIQCNERIVGTLAFNVMLLDNAEWQQEIAKSFSTVWHDVGALKDAKVIQYCNEGGQKKRLELERVWEDFHAD